jgi:hypothetical protein
MTTQRFRATRDIKMNKKETNFVHFFSSLAQAVPLLPENFTPPPSFSFPPTVEVRAHSII